ncbi:hypothetical protein AXF42_Ash004673 [Apostasia shenzhenica]|uniref:Rho GTPase-activating protein gacA n=1 Tax=Apostasia shenzhenica TaxID=1088818 RepID=A0A2I0BHB6_9ASPA|nr:hypothetical protein AXF42_Ash004673 [Apostasia shenzhenica]
MATVLPPLLRRNPTDRDGLAGQRSLLSASEVEDGEGLSLLAILLAVLRKYLARFLALGEYGGFSMEIGRPTDVRHVAHVTFDRFHGFLGLPVEFEPEVPQRPPSARKQCSYDTLAYAETPLSARRPSGILDRKILKKFNLLLLISALMTFSQLQAEGIFRITAENTQEEYVRDQLNNGIVPDSIDVHRLAGLIKAWFRELPAGVLDYLEPELLMQCKTEEECASLMKLLPPTQAALLDWAINLMADVVQEKQQNKMNDRNVAVVFAPNMTQLADPLTAVMHVVQVMNFLKMLISRTLREREEASSDYVPASPVGPPDDNDDGRSEKLGLQDCRGEETEEVFEQHKTSSDDPSADGAINSSQDSAVARKHFKINSAILRAQKVNNIVLLAKNVNLKKGCRRTKGQLIDQTKTVSVSKVRATGIMNQIHSMVECEGERVEAWR